MIFRTHAWGYWGLFEASAAYYKKKYVLMHHLLFFLFLKFIRTADAEDKQKVLHVKYISISLWIVTVYDQFFYANFGCVVEAIISVAIQIHIRKMRTTAYLHFTCALREASHNFPRHGEGIVTRVKLQEYFCGGIKNIDIEIYNAQVVSHGKNLAWETLPFTRGLIRDM